MANAALLNQFEIGIVGLDPCARALARTLTEHGVTVTACDDHPQNIKALRDEAPGSSIHIAATVKEMVELLHPFRVVVFAAADITGDLFREALGQLEPLDLLIDAGPCHFKDCERRARLLAERNIRHLDLGVIDAGLILMAGGRPETFLSARPLLESMAAGDDGEPRLSRLGAAPAGHFVKMIYDGIEYSLMQLALETFDLMKNAADLSDEELRAVAGGWPVALPQRALPDDAAQWTVQAARELNSPAPTIEAAAGLRTLSELERRNDLATTPFRQPVGHFSDETESVLEELQEALQAAVVITYAEAIAVLSTGSRQYGFDIDVAEVLRLWKGCDSQRAALLDEMILAIEATPRLPNLLHDDDLSGKVMEQQESLRHAIWRAGQLGTSVPTLAASLDYLDAFRGAWLPVNLIQVPPTRCDRRTPVRAGADLDLDWNQA